jgi:hypothetical protein
VVERTAVVPLAVTEEVASAAPGPEKMRGFEVSAWVAVGTEVPSLAARVKVVVCRDV